MLELGRVNHRTCQGINRRGFLQLGGIGFLGLSLADVFRLPTLSQEPSLNPVIASKQREKNCIFIYLAGGPSQLETFDPKPQAPSHIRGPWGAIPSKTPGLWLGEMLPNLARQTDKYALIRSLNHTHGLHNPWPMLTGNMTQRTTHGAAVTYLRGKRVNFASEASLMPPFIHLGAKLSVGGGTLGQVGEPLEIANPTAVKEALADFTLRQEISGNRYEGRKTLLNELDRFRRSLDRDGPKIAGFNSFHQKGLEILTSPHVREAFDLSREKETLRDRYGANSFGQSCLLSRRLIEAGTRYVQIAWYDREDGFAVGWDVHGDDLNGLVRMEQQLCPRFDQGLSALLNDLEDRDMLKDTLVCVTGEFGRTPNISRLGGRDHWPFCFSALMAGGGVPGGAVIGASDARAAYPTDRPISPADFAATIFNLLGVDVNLEDRLRPAIFDGHAMNDLITSI